MVKLNSETLLDAGLIPVAELAKIGRREGISPRPPYQVHRWFARRFGSAFRALLIAAASSAEEDFWSNYYRGVDWHGHKVLDPFVGGGTSVIESLRLGADVVGVDVDAIACAITRFEAHLKDLPDLLPTLDQLKSNLGQELAPYYSTVTPSGETRQVLHYFWVQLVDCSSCGATLEAHPHFRLAYEAQGAKQWVFCPKCHSVDELDKSEEKMNCRGCGLETKILDGPVRYGKLTCPHCGETEQLINVASRTGTPPRWRLFALETLEPPLDRRVVPMKQRCFRSATKYDQKLFGSAEEALQVRIEEDSLSWTLPTESIPEANRADDRLIRYGYSQYTELFNARQQLHLSHLAQAIDELPASVREAFAIAFSNHLATNCMMTHYAFGWRRLAPLFSIRAYRHVTRPVEINPWLDGTGRGTFPNAVRQVQRAVDWIRSPKEPLPEGGFRSVDTETNETQPEAKIVQADSRNLEFLEDSSIDLVLTDPPYFDNFAYSELSDFFLPWLQLLKIIPHSDRTDWGINRNLAAKSRDTEALEEFQNALRECFFEITRVLKMNGRLIFTYQHHTPGAWYALAKAIVDTNLQPIQLIPLLGDSSQGPGKGKGNIRWDAVFVFIKSTKMRPKRTLSVADETLKASEEHYLNWARELADLSKIKFRIADRCNFYRACLVAGALGMFDSGTTNSCSQRISLEDLLDASPP